MCSRHTWSLAYATKLTRLLGEINPNKKFTMIVPTNYAWEKVQRDFSTVFRNLADIKNPDYVRLVGVLC